MELYRLGAVPWLESQLLYHALPRVGRSGLLLLVPDSPIVSIGYYQDIEQEVDLTYCEEQSIPVFRREVGGGGFYLDGRQVLFQLVLPKTHVLLEGNRQQSYRRILEPIVSLHESLGLPAELGLVNDVVVDGSAVAEVGMAEIGDFAVFSGVILLDFNCLTMARALNLPSEACGERFYRDLESSMTSLTALLDTPPSVAQIYNLLEMHFAALLGALEPVPIDDRLRREANFLARRMLSPAWLYRRGRYPPLRGSQGRAIFWGTHKAPGGLLRAAVEFDEERIASVSFSGDFFAYPPECISWLEQSLEGVWAFDAAYALAQVYEAMPFETPGIGPEDWVQALPLDVLD